MINIVSSKYIYSKRKLLMLVLALSLLILLPDAAYGENLREKLELPRCEDSQTVVSHTGYTLCYSEKYEQAKWVGYELTRREVLGDTPRTDNFRRDPKIASESATLDDYRYSGYDRGHLAPAADFSWSREAMSETFYLSNMSPQKPGFNRGIWRSLESQVREWVLRDEALLVVTGPLFEEGGHETVGENEVVVPEAYYKVLLDIREPEHKGIGFLLPHESGSEPLSSYAVSIDKVEKVSGIDFFHAVEDSLEEKLESRLSKDQWFDGKDYQGDYRRGAESGEAEKNELESEEVKKEDAPAKYWINSGSNTRHNSDCRYYGATEEGYYTDEKVGEPCGICGG